MSVKTHMTQPITIQRKKLDPVKSVVVFEAIYLILQAVVPVVGWADLVFPLDDIVFCAILFVLTWKGAIDKDTLKGLLARFLQVK